MAAGPWRVFNLAKAKFWQKKIDLTADTMKIALTTNAQTLHEGFRGTSTDCRYSDLTAQVANGNGYTTGGATPGTPVLSYYVASATIAAGGTGGTNGTQTVTGTTGTGTMFTASVTVSGGIITAILSITLGGTYTALPTNPAAEPVTGASLAGAQLALIMGVRYQLAAPSWPSSTYTAKYGVLYSDTATNKDLIAFLDLETTVGAGVSPSNGTLQITQNTDGIFKND
jgi:hypothetical protein